MELCPRCISNRVEENEIICRRCMEWLCHKYHVLPGTDPMDNAEIRKLVESYKKISDSLKGGGV